MVPSGSLLSGNESFLLVGERSNFTNGLFLLQLDTYPI